MRETSTTLKTPIADMIRSSSSPNPIAASLSNAWLAVPLLVAVGCGVASGPSEVELSKHRQQFVLSEEPAGAVAVLDLRDELLAEPSSPGEPGGEAAVEAPPLAVPGGEPVVVVGRVGGVPNPWRDAQPGFPWVEGEARFFIADAAAAAEIEAHAHDHGDGDHSDCPFCAKAAKSNVLCAIRFVDEKQNPIKIDARELFDLTGEEMVVVRGAPKVVGEGDDALLIVEANGIYVRR